MQAKALKRTQEGIEIEWQDGHLSPYATETLRRLCPCAVCKGMEGREGEMIPRYLLPPKKIQILSAEPMGWYALQFRFNDGHDTGIYAYEFLRKHCPCEQCQSKST